MQGRFVPTDLAQVRWVRQGPFSRAPGLACSRLVQGPPAQASCSLPRDATFTLNSPLFQLDARADKSCLILSVSTHEETVN